MSSQAKDEEVNKITEDAFGNTTPVLTTHQRNVKVGTLEDASDPNNQQNTKDGFVYMDFAQLEEEELDVDYEIDQEGLNQALEEATAMAAAQLTSTPPYMTYPNGGASVPSGRMVRASGWCRSQRFPVKLYALLSQPQLSHIITWMPHGRSWKVLKPREFEASILPVFFESDNYHSFNRVINAWSFRRKSYGPDRGSYFHELFLRGKPHLQKYMRRLPRTHKKLAMAKPEEPDFFHLEKTSRLPTLAEAKYRLEARKMRRLKEHFEGDTIVRSVPIRNAPTGSLTTDHLQQVNFHRQALKQAGGSFMEMGDPLSRQPAVEEDRHSEKNPANGNDSPPEATEFRLDQDLREQHQRAQMMRQADLIEQERLRRMREDQFIYQHQMTMMQPSQNPNSAMGLPYGGMGYIGHPNFNPYTPPPL